MDEGITFEEADFLLKRDWALGVDDIDEMLWRLDTDGFQEVMNHYSEYPARVQTLLDTYKPTIHTKFRSCKVVCVENEFYESITENE